MTAREFVYFAVEGGRGEILSLPLGVGWQKKKLDGLTSSFRLGIANMAASMDKGI